MGQIENSGSGEEGKNNYATKTQNIQHNGDRAPLSTHRITHPLLHTILARRKKSVTTPTRWAECTIERRQVSVDGTVSINWTFVSDVSEKKKHPLQSVRGSR